MRLGREAIERILDTWPVARLATLAEDGRAELVPVVFARSDGALWSPLDGKPKRGTELSRVRNVRRDTRVCLLLDHWDDDWDKLWWLRVDGRAQLVAAGGAAAERAAAALRAKYPRYASGATPLFAGEPRLVRIEVERQLGWAAGPRAAIC
ncbi:MAG TPA: TIGR03668 family PPOX class F420-dependent oxidoreductase [Myxococcota bacterium]|nr:TIGR03668 family PPOX class F420-dependent oxidoreductase [Myxococcota bacterium]